MVKIEELVASIKRPTINYADQDFYDVDIERIMKQYAEFYARKVLEIAAESAKTKWEYVGDGSHEGWDIVDKDSILNIKLPEHE